MKKQKPRARKRGRKGIHARSGPVGERERGKPLRRKTGGLQAHVPNDIAQRVRTEAALGESEAKYRALVEHIPAIVYVAALNRKSTTLYVSPQIEQFLGFSQDEYRADPDTWRKQIHPEDRSRVIAELVSCRVSDKPFLSEYRMITKRGAVVWFRDEAVVVRDAKGKALFLQGIMYDVTDQRKMETALQKVNDCFVRFGADFKQNVTLITRTVGEILGATCVLYNRKEGDLLVTLDGWKIPSTLQKVGKANGHICCDLIEKGCEEPLVIHNLQESPYSESDPNVRKFRLNTYIGYPVRLGGRRVASLCAVFQSDFNPDEFQLSLFQILARAACVEEDRRYATDALEKSHGELEARIAERTAELRAVNESLLQEIAARRKAEEGLRRSEFQFRTLVEFTSDMELWIGAEREILYISPSCERLTGYTSDELMRFDRISMKIIHPEEISMVAEQVERAYRREEIDGFDFRIVRKDGDIRWVSISCRPVIGPEGAFLGIRGSIRDISDRKRMEEALQKSEQNYRELVQGANSIILRMDVHGNITFANEFAHRFFGYEEGEMVGRNLVGTIVPRTDSSGRDLEEMIGDIIKHPEDYVSNENENIRRNGERVWIIWTNKAILDGKGKIIGVLCIGSDITMRKRAEEQIIREKEFSELLVSSSIDGIVAFDREMRYTVWNPGMENITGLSKDKTIGRRSLDIFPFLKESGVDKYFHDVLSGESVVARDRRYYIPQTGKEGFFEGFYSPLRNSAGEIIGGLGIIRDITERKRREEQLLHAQKMEAMGTLTGGIAHDFNNILAGLMGYVSIMKMNLKKQSPLAQDMDSVEKLLQRGASLTGKLLAFSRRGRYQPVLININKIVQEVLAVLQQTAGKGIEMIIDFAPDISNIMADEGEIHQVAMNLCLNACESMSEGGTLTVGTENVSPDRDFLKRHPHMKGGAFVSLCVRDTGIGMDKKELEHIFEPFFTTKVKKSRTGLGLAVVSTIIEKLTGCITVESAPGEGSTFTVYLPASAEAAKGAEPAATDRFRGTETILVVDDEHDVRESLTRWFTEMGYSAIGAVSGEEAVAMLKGGQVKIDLVVLDIVMNGMGGAQAFHELRKIASELPIIICTGYPLDESLRVILEKEATDFIHKPFRFDELAGKIRNVFDHRENSGNTVLH
ncbi:MAG: PAS domain S-box protein [Candidatus Aureabacteria bacterium]|nr:PAS domain S-box protein [Candidatus Auribacterota bacterium]